MKFPKTRIKKIVHANGMEFYLAQKKCLLYYVDLLDYEYCILQSYWHAMTIDEAKNLIDKFLLELIEQEKVKVVSIEYIKYP